MKLGSGETKAMQKFAVRTPDKNVLDIKNQAFQTLGLLAGNERFVRTASFRSDDSDEANTDRTSLACKWRKK